MASYSPNTLYAALRQALFSSPLDAIPKAEQPQPPGLIQPGNIDLNHRPVVKNPDGSYSTVRSIGIEVDGRQVLIPTVSPDGRVLSNQDAIRLYQQSGQHLGIFDNENNANAYGESLHNQQAKQYAPPVDPDVPKLAKNLGVAPDAAQRYRDFFKKG